MRVAPWLAAAALLGASAPGAGAAHAPAVVSFELDGVLWPFTAAQALPPFSPQPDGLVQDAAGAPLRACPDAAAVLAAAKELDPRLVTAAATRAEKPEATWGLLDALVPDASQGVALGSLFDYKQVHPGEKFQHLERLLPRIALNNGVALTAAHVLHFDASRQNLRTVADKLPGATTYFVESGCMTLDDWYAGLSRWQAEHPLPTPSPSPTPSGAPPRTGVAGDAGWEEAPGVAFQFD